MIGDSENLCILLDFPLLFVFCLHVTAVSRAHLPSRASEGSRCVRSAVSDLGRFVSRKGK